jgi:hypothetical protein
MHGYPGAGRPGECGTSSVCHPDLCLEYTGGQVVTHMIWQRRLYVASARSCFPQGVRTRATAFPVSVGTDTILRSQRPHCGEL